MRLTYLLALWGLTIGAAAAAPTSLNQIPTPDLVSLQQYSAVVQNSNTALQGDPTVFHRPVFLPQLELGLTSSAEGGIDAIPGRSPGHYTAALNLKWKPVWENYTVPAVAIGVVQPVTDFGPTYYLVVTRTINFAEIFNQRFRAHHRNIKLRGRRIHAGLTHTPAGTFPLVGSDIEISDHFVFYSDWISGSPNAVSAGGVYVINDQNSVQAALLYGNHEQRINGLLLNYTRNAKW